MEVINTINPIELMIINSDEYKEFIEHNLDLEERVNYIIKNYAKWKNNGLHSCFKRDFCYFPNKTLPYKDSWSVDEPADYGTPKQMICKTWKRFESQMGTTSDKFELLYDYDPCNNHFFEHYGKRNYDNIEELRLIGEMFAKIGFNVFVVTFTSWRIGYDFSFVRLEDVEDKIEIPTKENEIYSVHICMSKRIKK